MSGGGDWPRMVTACTSKDHRPYWQVVTRNGNYSAFSGYHFTPSRYSLVRCAACGARWRTKAAYVSSLPGSPDGGA